jgi:hypothetical protein
MKRTFHFVAGLAGVLIGLGFVFPAIAQWRTHGGMSALSVGLLALGTLLTIGGGMAAARALKARKA